MCTLQSPFQYHILICHSHFFFFLSLEQHILDFGHLLVCPVHPSSAIEVRFSPLLPNTKQSEKNNVIYSFWTNLALFL